MPDNSGFISGSLDGLVVICDSNSSVIKMIENPIPVRITDLAILPYSTRILVSGLNRVDSSSVDRSDQEISGLVVPPKTSSYTLVVYNLVTDQVEDLLTRSGEVTSLTLTEDAKLVLMNIQDLTSTALMLIDWKTKELVQKYTGHHHVRHVVRSCFVGSHDVLVASGSEDSQVYVWDRESGELKHTFRGHTEGTANDVAYHPRFGRIFASCGDDGTVRFWEIPQD